MDEHLVAGRSRPAGSPSRAAAARTASYASSPKHHDPAVIALLAEGSAAVTPARLAPTITIVAMSVMPILQCPWIGRQAVAKEQVVARTHDRVERRPRRGPGLVPPGLRRGRAAASRRHGRRSVARPSGRARRPGRRRSGCRTASARLRTPRRSRWRSTSTDRRPGTSICPPLRLDDDHLDGWRQPHGPR